MRAIAMSFGCAALALFTGCDRGAQENVDRPQTVVLVTFDTFRCDRIGAYGGDPKVTPHLDALANRGAKFERCLSVAPITLPAHTSILSGTDPIHHGLRVNGLGTVPRDQPLLQEQLKRTGYATGAFVSSKVLDRRHGLDRAFDRYDDKQGTDGEVGREQRRGRTTVTSALAWLSSLGEKPAFLWVHLFDAHAPYQAPSEFASQFADPYLAEMAYADQCLGDLLTALEAKGRLADSLVVVTADHGEGLGDHGESTHTIFVYDTTIRVPWVMAGKGIPNGRSIPGTASMISIAPTLLELLGIEKPAAMYGESLAGVLNGGALAADSSARFESQAAEFYYGFAPLSGIELQGKKLIAAPRPELYAPLVDPGELDNLFDKDMARGNELKRALDAIDRQREVKRAPPATMTSAQEKEMKELGYFGAKSVRSGIDAKDGIERVERLIRAQLKGFDDPRAAVAELEKFVAEDPTVAEAWELLADFRLQTGSISGAIEGYHKAIGLRIDDAGLRVKLGDSFLGKNPPDLTGAKGAYTVAIEKEPGNVDATIKLANLTLGFDRDPATARRMIEGIVRNGSGPGAERAEAYVMLGFACLALGDRAAAMAALAKAKELGSTDPSVQRGITELERALGPK
jgi:arylsulfatase A-like enzyme